MRNSFCNAHYYVICPGPGIMVHTEPLPFVEALIVINVFNLKNVSQYILINKYTFPAYAKFKPYNNDNNNNICTHKQDYLNRAL